MPVLHANAETHSRMYARIWVSLAHKMATTTRSRIRRRRTANPTLNEGATPRADGINLKRACSDASSRKAAWAGGVTKPDASTATERNSCSSMK